MTDTLFGLGAIASNEDRVPNYWWDTQWYYTRRTPRPVLDWLLESNVDHSVGWECLPGREDLHPHQICVFSFITVHDPDAALELRMRWNAQHTTLAQIRDHWNNEGLVMLAFEKEEPR